MIMLPGSGPVSMLGKLAGIIKPGRAVLAVLFWVVWPWGLGKSHLLTGCKEQGINSKSLSLRVAEVGGLL